MTTYTEALARLDYYMARRAIIRFRWTDTEDRACLLAATSVEVAATQDELTCPTEIMPQWLAFLIPCLSGGVSEPYWPTFLEEYHRAAHAWGELDARAWRAVQAGTARKVLAVAARNAGVEAPIVGTVDALWARAQDGVEPSTPEWRTAQSQAAATARAALYLPSAWSVAWAAADAAEAGAGDDGALTAAAKETVVGLLVKPQDQRAAWDEIANACLAEILRRATP